MSIKDPSSMNIEELAEYYDSKARKDNAITFRVSSAELEILKRAAQKDNYSNYQKWMRDKLAKAAADTLGIKQEISSRLQFLTKKPIMEGMHPLLPPPRDRCSRGFTLAELLLALVILGVIATFTIPKVLSSQADSKRKAVFKETIASLSELLNNGIRTGSVTDDDALKVYVLANVNAVKICPTNSLTQLCWAHPDNTTTDNRDEPGFIMHTGATVAGFGGGAPAENEHIVVDWNGSLPPNVEGDDQIGLRINIVTVGSNRAGTIIARPGVVPAETLFADIFKY